MKPIAVTVAGVAALAALAAVLLLSGDPQSAPRASAAAPAVAATAAPGAPSAVRVVTKQGHPTHPTWYHDAQVLARGDRVTVAWNGRGKIQAAQVQAGSLKILAKATISATKLGGATDSTGTDTDRHDVPAVVADAAGRLGFLYGGGSLAARGRDGPLARWSTAANALAPLAPERALQIGGGAAFDFESATGRSGVVHLIGQHGRGNTGSLIDLRLAPDGRWKKPRELIRGGRQAGGCVLGGTARGCNRFAIARIAADPASGRLHLVWGWSEASLSGKCHTDAGYCDHDLEYAYSDDDGASWHDAGGQHTVRIADGPLPADAPDFRVADGHVGLFKAIAIGPAGPLIVYTTFANNTQTLQASRLTGGDWTTVAVAPDDGSRWGGSFVLRGGAGYTLWTPTGSAIHRFTSTDGAHWAHDVVYRGPAWSLTGAPAGTGSGELLLWRGRQENDRSWVVLGAFPR
jgi:hypothetical protein